MNKFALIGCLTVAIAGELNAAEFLTPRHVYIRGERVSVALAVEADVDAVNLDVSGWLGQSVRPEKIGEVLRCDFSFDSNQLRPGDYEVRAQPLRQGQPGGAPAVFSLTIAPAPNPQRFPVWNWSIPDARNLAWWRERGFTGFRLPEAQDPVYSARLTRMAQNYLEDGARLGLDVGMTVNPLRSAQLAKVAPSEGRNTKVYPRHPGAMEHAAKTTDNLLRSLQGYPALKFALLNSEYQIPPMDSQIWRDLVAKEAGLAPHEIPQQQWFRNAKNVFLDPEKIPAQWRPKGGLIEDDNPVYRYLQWWWQRGHGTSLMNQELHRRIKAVRPDILTWHDPYRLAPVRNSHTGLDMVSTWTYGHPDIKRLGYTAVLQAAARPEKQKVMQTISLFMYDRFVRPVSDSTADLLNDFTGNDASYNLGPDATRESIWLVMSQRPDVLGFFYATANSPDKTQLDPFVTSPETFDAIGQVSRTLIEPYGPTILKTRRERPKVAVLMSASALWFNGTQGWVNEAILPFTCLLMMNHVPYDVVLDEDVQEGRLENYEALVIPNGEALLRGVHQKIVDFSRRGKRVIADRSLAAEIPGAERTNYDFAFVKMVDGTLFKKATFVTAEKYLEQMEEYADDLKPLLAGLQGTATSPAKRVLTNTLESGAVRYVFAINDYRMYDLRFGVFKFHMESGLRRPAEIELTGAEGKTLYDALERREITAATSANGATVRTILPAAGGKLIAVLPEKIAKVELTLPPGAERGKPANLNIRVLGASGAPIMGSLPLRIEVNDSIGRSTEYTRFATTASDGSGFTLPLLPALNDQPGTWSIRVTDYLSGQRAEAELAVQ